MRHNQSTNHRRPQDRTPPKPHVLIPEPHQPSTLYHTNNSRNHQHCNMRGDQNNNGGLQQVPPVDK